MTARTSTPPAGCRSTSSTARSTRGPCSADLTCIPTPVGRARGASPSSCAGASSTPTCCGTSPASAWHDLRGGLAAMPYDAGPDVHELVAAWRRGRTGYPFVDAGMRQLLAEGWMHNRLRMVTASFLVKDLHVWWPLGARHFLDHLLDGDLASNNHGWQWVAGTGTDAAPYFRVFNPVAQGKRFDPDGDVRPSMGHRARPRRRSRGARAVAARGRVRARVPRTHRGPRRRAPRVVAPVRPGQEASGVTHAIVEVRAFLRAALASPVPGIAEDPPECRPPPTVRSSGSTLLVGVAILAADAAARAGRRDASIGAALGLAAVWAAGAFASGPLHLGTARTRSARVRPSRWSPSLILGLFAARRLPPGRPSWSPRVPALREPADGPPRPRPALRLASRRGC